MMKIGSRGSNFTSQDHLCLQAVDPPQDLQYSGTIGCAGKELALIPHAGLHKETESHNENATVDDIRHASQLTNIRTPVASI